MRKLLVFLVFSLCLIIMSCDITINGNSNVIGPDGEVEGEEARTFTPYPRNFEFDEFLCGATYEIQSSHTAILNELRKAKEEAHLNTITVYGLENANNTVKDALFSALKDLDMKIAVRIESYDKEFAFVDDLEWIPVICNMNFRTLSDKVYTQDEIFAWFFVKDIFELKDTIIKHPIYLRYGISLSTNPMYYYIPCQYVAFTDANTVEMITDGLDTKNDKFSRYHITIKLDGTVINGASNIKVELKENVFVPDLPEDADSKTYQLKAVNGKLSWVE